MHDYDGDISIFLEDGNLRLPMQNLSLPSPYMGREEE
jgi:hypothetical protein